MWKEVVGTLIGVLPLVLMLGLALLKWGGELSQQVAVDAQRITSLEMQRNEITSKLDRISDKIDVLSQSVAAQGALERR